MEAKREDGPALTFPVVAVGASAGGLESLVEFFSAVPRFTGMAFVVIQHLSPHFGSMMDQLLARRTDMPILTAETGMRVRPDTVYLLPPGKMMVMVDDQLVLTDKDPDELMLPIDRFMESLARAAGDRAVGVVLSGTGSDGTRGVQEIQRHGGVCLAESAETAKFHGMPRSAIECGAVEAVLAPADMPAAIERVMSGERAPTSMERTKADMSALLIELQRRYRIDFHLYKPGTLNRRLARRAQLARMSPEGYIAHALETPSELDAIRDDFMIKVSNFFRDGRPFEVLADELDNVVRRLSDRPLRVWCAACATGEEAYTLAMLVVEAFERADQPVQAKIFATDLDRGAVNAAARGVFSMAQVADLDPDRLERFFEAHEEGYVVRPIIRELVVFSPHDLLHDAPFTNLDLVSCRNLLIYLDVKAQAKALSFFHFGLRSEGLLLLGNSETVEPLAEGFEAIDEPHRLFRRRPHRTVAPGLLEGLRQREHGLRHRLEERQNQREELALMEALCSRFVPSSVLLDAERNVLRTFGGAERYLSVKPGRLQTDFLSMLDAEAKSSLAGALRVVEREGEPLVVRSVHVGRERDPERVTLRVERLDGLRGQRARYLVSFIPERTVEEPAPREGQRDAAAFTDREFALLQEELERARHHLQITVEELEASNEELQATNEELIASNEELQSTNEELSSVNEELYTVNTEYQNSITQLREANEDIRQLIANTGIATLFLDTELRIRRFTQHMAEIIDLEENDLGRRIQTFQHQLDWPGLYEAIDRAVASDEAVQKEALHGDGRRFLVRIHPYAESPEAPGGVVITMTDVSQLAKARKTIRDRERRLERITNALPVLVAYVDDQERYQFINDAYVGLWGRSRKDIVGEKVRDLLAPEDYAVARPHIEKALAGERADFDINVSAAVGERRSLVAYVPHFSEAGDVLGFYVAITDITERHRTQMALESARLAATQASRAKSEFLANMSHEIRTPLAAIMGYAELLSSEVEGDRARAHLDTVRRNGKHLLAIINDVFDLSRIEEGHHQPELSVFPPAELAWEVQDIFLLKASELGLDLRLELPPKLPDAIVSDPKRLRQILINLVSNAMKFTDRGWIAMRMDLGPEGRLRLEVEDTGIGFPQEEADVLFEPFRQLDGSGTRKYEGSGLGLAISCRLAQSLGGTIEAHGRPGEGARFTVTIPAKVPAHASMVPTRRASDAPTDQTMPHGLSGRVLVVDDNDDIRMLIVEALRRVGITVAEAGDGAGALEHIANTPVDLVLMDVQMPGMDGLETTRTLRRRGVRIPVIAVTARALSTDRAECIEAGCTDYLAKPIQMPALLGMVGRLVGGAPRVLVVDDHADTAELLSLALHRSGLESHTANGGERALETFADKEPNVVVSDLNLGGGMDGYELARRLRSLAPEVRLIAMSGSTDARAKSLAAGFDHFVAKPAELPALLALITA